MKYSVRLLLLFAMWLLTLVSIYTTYASLTDSILPKPLVPIPLPNGVVWHCSIMAFGLSVAIGLMLYAMKMAIIDGHKRLGIFGLVGMTMVAFISIVFNMDVLYRTADQEFYLRYSNDKMRSTYEEFMSRAQGKLQERRTELLRTVAKQEGELDAEVKGLRKAPAGYGQYAKEETYKLTVLQKETEVEIENINNAMAVKEEADTLLRTNIPQTLADIDATQAQLRVIIKDLASYSGEPLPELVRTESPLFAVFAKLFDFKNVGFKEIFFLMIAFFLDLGDIIGYSLIPNRKEKKDVAVSVPLPSPRLTLVSEPATALAPLPEEDFEDTAEEGAISENAANGDDSYPGNRFRRRRPTKFRLGRH